MEKDDTKNLFVPADILIPRGGDMPKWSVIACDQHTSEPEYWERVDEAIGEAPSTMRMMLPEHLYTSGRVDALIADTKAAMTRYLDGGVFEEYKDSFVYVERRLWGGKLRCGIVGALDLECYDYAAGAKPPVRATEETVVEKLPIRIRLREGAALEMPHVLVLVDDPCGKIIEPLAARKDRMQKLYDFELMERGGHIAGWRITGGLAGQVQAALARHCDATCFSAHYGLQGEPVMPLVTGDGNHSLATAKACWEALKPTLTEAERASHPARYALVEIVNIREESLEFYPINRVLFDVSPDAVLQAIMDYFPGAYLGAGGALEVCYVYGNETGILSLPESAGVLAIGALSKFFDEYLPGSGGRIDFVHGDDVVIKLSRQPGRLGFILPAIDKGSFFLSVIKDGTLPRKTFSMGHSNDKRFYLECRRIK